MIAAIPGLPPFTLTIPLTNTSNPTPTPPVVSTPPSQPSLPAHLPPTSHPTPTTSSIVLPVLLVLSLVLMLLGGSLLCWNYLHDTSNGRHCKDVRDESVRRGGEEGEGEEERQRRRVGGKEADSVTSEDDLEEREKEEGAWKDVRSGTGWWARVRMTMRVGGGAQTRDVEPGAR